MRSVAEHAPLAYERVVLPCSTMNCGDIFHRRVAARLSCAPLGASAAVTMILYLRCRSTLDPALRGEFRQVDPIVFVGLGLTLAYLTATPGVLQGAWDTYVLAARQRRSQVGQLLRPSETAQPSAMPAGPEHVAPVAHAPVRSPQVPLTLQDFRMGRKIATGGFGEVYRATLVDPTTGSEKDVILKKAKDFGEAEVRWMCEGPCARSRGVCRAHGKTPVRAVPQVWMNERLSRSKPGAVAEFIQAFDEGDDVLWLAWKYEGDFTLGELMASRRSILINTRDRRWHPRMEACDVC